jgi:hypothetical protein
MQDHARVKGVEVLPTFLLLKDGKECKRIVGINKEELDNSIQEHKGGPDKGAPSVKHPITEAAPVVVQSVVPALLRGRRRAPVMPRGRRSRYPFFFSGWR